MISSAVNPTSLTSLSALERKPWICPRCHKVNAPHADQCKCTPGLNGGLQQQIQQMQANQL